MPDPVLRTERLVLRPLDAGVARTLLDRPPAGGFPTADDTALLHRTAAATDAVRHTYVLEHEGSPVGTLGIAGAVSPDGDQELGYALVPAARGQGLGTEAVGALCAVLEQVPGVRRLTAEVKPGNEASLRLLHRLGFKAVGDASEGHVRLGRVPPGAPSSSRRIAGRHVC